ncbi:MAG: DNA repair protein RecN [Marinilabiliaceae bacterium]|nr:DNA repair protein RecN [Marinilabiliaceae bacterium]
MLKRLFISNYALIDEVEINFDKGLSVITGETGAGKSIMIGALSLILGQRSDTSFIKDKERKCVVEAHLNIDGYGLKPFFDKEDIDYDTQTVIRREISESGKSRAFVNDTPVNLNFLKELSQNLIDIHSQHQNLLLGDYSFQLKVVDAVAENSYILENYKIEFSKLKSLQKKRTQLIELNEKQKSDKDYLSFQAQQLNDAKLKEGEQEELEQNLEQLIHAEEILTVLESVKSLLSLNEFPIIDGLHQSKNEINKIAGFLKKGYEITNRLETIYVETKELAREITEISETIEFDPQLIKRIQARLDLIYSLQQKHRVDSVKALLALKIELDDKLAHIDSFDESLSILDAQIDQQEQISLDLAQQLSDKRKGVFNNIQNNIEEQLHDLGMPNARFAIMHKKSENLRDDGADEIQFMFSANKNSELDDIPKVASGGEMSRLMLCIKSLLSTAKGLPTLIFDEIDMGVSGEIADKMGRIMQKMSTNIQIISITHLPQIASKGKQHYKVYKTDTSFQTISEIKLLADNDRLIEIASMLSGAELTEAALQNAKELIKNSDF